MFLAAKSAAAKAIIISQLTNSLAKPIAGLGEAAVPQLIFFFCRTGT